MKRDTGKRILDLALAIAALILFSPIMALTAILIRFSLGSPVLFRQQRPGLHKKPFCLYKFRTMKNLYDGNGFLLPDGERLTNLGKSLRRMSLDELPELLNVIKGEMSLVGPRPLLLEYLEYYTVEQMKRHEVKPGITGWAQVNGRNALNWEEKFELDLWYVNHLSLVLDLKIISRSILNAIKGDEINQPGHATAGKYKGK